MWMVMGLGGGVMVGEKMKMLKEEGGKLEGRRVDGVGLGDMGGEEDLVERFGVGDDGEEVLFFVG
uniref:hypothetical protein n=1 Tax=Neisseria sicca TaxID=490 RepID=UPI001C99850B